MEIQDPNKKIAEIFYRLNIGYPIKSELITEVFELILTHPEVRARDFQLGAFLSGLMAKGLTALEIVNLINIAIKDDKIPMLRPSIPKEEKLIGVAGSGKKGFKTFNISTPACFVAATLGAYIAKTGSKATSSLSGSLDFYNAIGAKPLTYQKMSEVLVSTGIGIFSIESLIPKLDKVYGGKILHPTPLSFGLPAIVNPIICDSFLYGLSHPNINLCLEVFKEFKYKDVMVISSTHDKIHYIDEFSPIGENSFGKITKGVLGNVELLDTISILGHPPYNPFELKPGKSLFKNIQITVRILAGKGTPAQEEAIALNAAMILLLSNKAKTIKECFNLASSALYSGRCLAKLEQFIIATGGTTKKLQMFLKKDL